MTKKIKAPAHQRYSFFFRITLLLLLSIVAVFYWYQIRYFPYHLNSASFTINSAKVLSLRSFTPLTLSEFQVSHSPFFMIGLVFFWNLFGESIATSHAIMIPFLIIYLFSSYLLAKKFLSTKESLMTCFLVAFFPLVVNQYQLISIDLAVAAFVTLCLYALVDSKYIVSMLALSFGVILSWKAILVMPAIALYLIAKKNRQSLRLFIIPIGILVSWLLYHGSITGWYFVSPEIGLAMPPDIATFFSYSFFVLKNIAFNYLSVLTLPGFLLGLVLLIRKNLNTEEKYLYLLTVISTLVIVLFYGWVGGYLPELFLSLLPIYFISSLVGYDRFKKIIFNDQHNWLLLVLLSVFIFYSLSQWRVNNLDGPGFHLRPDTNLAYQDTIITFQEAAAYAQIYYPDAIVVGGYPESYQLQEPHQGYVTTPMKFQPCDQFSFSDGEEYLLYIHPYHPSQIACNALMEDYTTVPIKRSERNGKWNELFLITATKSAALR